MAKESFKVQYGIVSVDATATGNSAVLAAQGAGTSILVKGIYMHALTATANQVGSMVDNTTSSGYHYRQNLAAKGDTRNLPLGGPWMLGTNSALYVNLATAGAVAVTVNYDVLQRQ